MPECREIALPDGSVVEAVIGYRSWIFVPKDGTVWLRSLFIMDAFWPQGEPMLAECFCPGESHTCGIHACRRTPRYHTRGWGEVALWGDVRVHEYGYRADNALPLALYAHENPPGLLESVAAYQYGMTLVVPEYINL